MPSGCGEAADERAEQSRYDERSAEELIGEGEFEPVDPVQECRTPRCECAKPESVGRQSEQDEDVILDAEQFTETAQTCSDRKSVV
jgi:hypothetical protein